MLHDIEVERYFTYGTIFLLKKATSTLQSLIQLLGETFFKFFDTPSGCAYFTNGPLKYYILTNVDLKLPSVCSP